MAAKQTARATSSTREGEAAPLDGRQRRWAEHKEERRRVIIDAAIAELEAADGAEVHVQQIAERAGLGRTVVYRHFADREDLDRAVQERVLTMLAAELLPQLTLDGTIAEIIRRIVGTYVGWTAKHPELHAFSEREVAGEGGTSPLQRAVTEIAAQVEQLIVLAAEQLGLDLRDDDAAALDPLVFALVGAVFGGVRRWRSRPERAPDVRVFTVLLSDTVWHMIDGHARRLGLELDPDAHVDDLVAQAFSDS